jgi:hypothetical protein
MASRPIFEGLIIDENDRPVGVSYVGDEAMYVVDDAGFMRHIPSEMVDRQVLQSFMNMIQGNESMISEQAAKMLGQDDIFSRAMLENQLKNLDKQIDLLFTMGIPEESRAYMRMTGFFVRIDMHGNVIEINQPAAPTSGEE